MNPHARSGPLVLMALVALISVALTRCAYADPIDMSNVHLKTESTCKTAGGSTVVLPPGYFLDTAKYAALDAELRRLQTVETRLNAENSSFREQAPSWQPGWKSLLGASILGMAAVLAIERL